MGTDQLIDIAKLDSQYRFLAYIRRLDGRKLRRLHRETFARYPEGHPWNVKIPKWVPRHYVERRLWYEFAVRNYHIKGEFFDQFRKEASRFLRQEYTPDDISAVLSIFSELKRLRGLDLQTIMQMDIERVDQTLMQLGYVVNGTDEVKRLTLFEIVDAQRTDVEAVPKYTTGRIIARATNRWVLADIIRRYPSLTWREFVDKFGPEMPTVNLRSFNDTKSRIRKEVGLKRMPYVRTDLVQDSD